MSTISTVNIIATAVLWLPYRSEISETPNTEFGEIRKDPSVSRLFLTI